MIAAIADYEHDPAPGNLAELLDEVAHGIPQLKLLVAGPGMPCLVALCPLGESAIYRLLEQDRVGRNVEQGSGERTVETIDADVVRWMERSGREAADGLTYLRH